MARISSEERQQKKAMLDAYIWEVFKEDGWDAVTYQRLSEKLNTRKSTIQRYYPSQADFLEGVVGKALPEMLPHLDLSSLDAFIESWSIKAQEPIFHNYLELFLLDAMKGLDDNFALGGMTNMMAFLKNEFNLDRATTERVFKLMIGDAVVRSIHSRQTKH